MISKFNKFFYPVLLKMKDQKSCKRFGDDLLNFCFDYYKNDKKFQTTKEELEEKVNETDRNSRCEDRVGWAISYLKQAKCI